MEAKLRDIPQKVVVPRLVNSDYIYIFLIIFLKATKKILTLSYVYNTAHIFPELQIKVKV